ncbi:MAG: Na+/H+ antiporter NhaA [Gammaproteobacteria bacterium]|jgi:Na+:H+ antiporter, NhaA family|nr:Na+/H+ antiporter NhaA [Gammaproteobacteria bacterium]|tara:strand:- start:2933 stop:4156 length:1224 start_codon:yes stop_codon:yes gene_type:complete
MLINKETTFNTEIFSRNFIRSFLKTESASGVLLIIFSLFAIFLANSDFANYYYAIKNSYISISFENFQLKETVHHWVNDGLMAIFFLVIGLELKREMINGQLSTFSKILLPGVAAVGGMAFPALIYIILNKHEPLAMSGWAIPTATDIAFSLAVLSVLGKRVPVSLKIFLLSLAIIDDLGAVMVIALYYTSEISYINLLYAFFTFLVLITLNILNVRIIGVYIFGGLFLWYFILHSGIHTTIAGVILASTIPFSIKKSSHSPLRYLEEKLHTFSGFIILPLFAFFNADIDLNTISINSLSNTVPMGIMLGLILGKPIGITLLTYLSIKLKLCQLPSNINMYDILGVSFLCGIGFTMSLFINALAFPENIEVISFGQEFSKSGIFFGSILSGIVGYIILKIRLNKDAE